MKLVTFQSFDAVCDLIKKGYLECDARNINFSKVGIIYDWISEKMDQQFKNFNHAKYPIWCWVKCYNNICPNKHKGTPVKGFDVKITFNKDANEVFITDFRRFSFLLNNQYIPKNIKDKTSFEQKLNNLHITPEELKAYVRKDKYEKCRNDLEFMQICDEIKTSFDRCITTESDVLQGCVWRIDLNEVEKIEVLPQDDHVYGSLNYIRSNGKRINWIDDYYKKLK